MIHIMAKRPWIKRPKKCQIAGCFKPAVSRQNCKKHDDVEYQAGKVAIWKERREYYIVAAHFHSIRREESTYKGMPFCDAWNPYTGGSFLAGESWIIENLGKRPPDGKWQLHIIDRTVGFMPGNLRWVPRDKHKQEELIAQVLLENQNLRNEIEQLKGLSGDVWTPPHLA